VDLFGVRLNVNGEIYKAGSSAITMRRDVRLPFDSHVEQMDAQGKDPLFVPMARQKL